VFRRIAALLAAAGLAASIGLAAATAGAAEDAPNATETRQSALFADLAGPVPPGYLPASSRNVDLVGRLELRGPFGGLAPKQIADVSVYKDFAYLNSWNEPDCTRGGVFVADISDPANPREVAFLPAGADSYHGEGAHVITVNTPDFQGDVLAVNNEPCTGTGEGGFDLYDVSNPRKPKLLVRAAGDRSPANSLTQDPEELANSAHSVFIWQDGPRAFAVAVDNTEGSDVDIFDITNPRNPVQITDLELDVRFPEVVGNSVNGNAVFLHDMIVKRVDGRMNMLVSYWDAGYVQLDVTDPANPTVIRDHNFQDNDPETAFAPPEGNAHQAEFSFDDRYILAADEDFSTYRTDFALVRADGTVVPSQSSEFTSTLPISDLPDQRLNGPAVFGGYGCSDDNQIPPRESVDYGRELRDDEEAILVVQRGPVGDPDADYPACTFQEKMDNAADAGYDGVLIAQRHLGSAEQDGAFAGSGTGSIPSVAVDHATMHNLFGEEPDFSSDYSNQEDEPQPGQVSVPGVTVRSTSKFDGWGYAHLIDRRTGEEIDSYAIPEAVSEQYASDFGDLSIHEWATDPATNLAYSAYYAGGFRVARFGPDGIQEVGHWIGEGGSNLWGVEQFTAKDGSRLIATSDRDKGLFIFRYTGPGNVGPTPPTPPAPPAPPAPAAPAATPAPVVTPVPTPVVVPRQLPRGVRAAARRTTGRRRTTLRTTGTVLLPAGITRAAGCRGQVQVRVKAGTRTVSTRRVTLRRDCTFSSSVSVLNRRIGRRTIQVLATFLGNDRLSRRSAPTLTARRS